MRQSGGRAGLDSRLGVGGGWARQCPRADRPCWTWFVRLRKRFDVVRELKDEVTSRLKEERGVLNILYLPVILLALDESSLDKFLYETAT